VTQVLVDDGETVVLGGVYSQVDRNSLDRVPFFGDLPYLGTLFRKNRVEKSRTELLIFVTPKILKEELTI
jgi:type IV pilus assembly protein PilQ